ncbi:sorting nexin-31 isoform X5 [Sphaerodactylus townsendi]|uniref:sorting nexin-31 isoform X5 n=1 Tax=Sphaerodactylus townsendi TaxID=933632 RepID=UPI002026DBB2|nr:sorting nexin-31 isoform X5 [Sphaerodactylus townsendi]
MKMHFSIPLSEDLLEKFGGRYVLYSVYLEGFLFCKVRYSQLHHWNEQLRQVFGRGIPSFPPKFYLAMTQSMADERRAQLEQYLQNVSSDSSVTNSDVFISFFRKLQLDTFKIQPEQAFLDVYLADGRHLRMDIQTSDTAERVLEVMSYKIELSKKLVGYFSLFLIQDQNDGKFSVLKKLAEFELPYVSLQSVKESPCKIAIRKWYMDPSLDKILMDCRTSVNLLYIQALQETERKWIVPTAGQMQKLQVLQKALNKIKGSLSGQGLDQVLEFRFEYNDSDRWRWIVFNTKQAFLLSSCFKKIISEQLTMTAKSDQDKHMELLEPGQAKKQSSHPTQLFHSGFMPRKRLSDRSSEEDCVFEEIREEDL